MINITLDWDNRSDLEICLFGPGSFEVVFSASVQKPGTLSYNPNVVNGVYSIEIRKYNSSGTAANVSLMFPTSKT